MSNWQYADVVPTASWRSAMTIPRELSIEKMGAAYWLRSTPVKELNVINEPPVGLKNIDAAGYDLTKQIKSLPAPPGLLLPLIP